MFEDRSMNYIQHFDDPIQSAHPIQSRRHHCPGVFTERSTLPANSRLPGSLQFQKLPP